MSVPTGKKKTLHDLFRPPIDLLHKGTFETVSLTQKNNFEAFFSSLYHYLPIPGGIVRFIIHQIFFSRMNDITQFSKLHVLPKIFEG